jgi:quercetin dioxygenase-like cupin family protein
MVRKNMLGTALAVLAGWSALGSHALAAEAGAKPANAALIPAAEVKWNEVPGMTGIQIAAVEGDPSKGPSHFLLKFAAGFAAPLHHHTANHFGTVVSGTLVLSVDGKEQRLPPGSFFSFSSQAPHATRCEAGAECVLSMDVRGKWDVVPEVDKGAAKKK